MPKIPPTPPATPSPPKLRALPPKSNKEKNIQNQLSPRQETPKRSGVRKRTISELKVDEDLSPKTKRRKIRERARFVVKQLNRVCHAKGESLGSILGECCVNGGRDTAKAQEAVRSAFDVMVKEKGARVWSSISAKTRSLYSVLDLLYFILPYTMRHPTVLTLWLDFSIVHGTFCFSHSISRNWHTKLTIFCFFGKNGQLRNFRLSMLCFQHPSSCIRLRSTSFRNPSREGIAGAANLHP